MFNSDMFDSTMDGEMAKYQSQRAEMDRMSSPMSGGTVIVDDATMKLLKRRVGIYRIVEIFGIRDDSGLTIRKMNDMKFLKHFGLLEEKNRKYLDEVIDICREKGVELYNTKELEEVGYRLKSEDLKTIEYAPVNIKEVMAEVDPLKDPESKTENQGDPALKKVKKDMDIEAVDINNLEMMPLKDIKELYKRTTGKGISPRRANDRQRFINKLRELKDI